MGATSASIDFGSEARAAHGLGRKGFSRYRMGAGLGSGLGNNGPDHFKVWRASPTFESIGWPMASLCCRTHGHLKLSCLLAAASEEWLALGRSSGL